jgi:hypothetical protein
MKHDETKEDDKSYHQWVVALSVLEDSFGGFLEWGIPKNHWFPYQNGLYNFG